MCRYERPLRGWVWFVVVIGQQKMNTFHRILEKSLPAQQKLRNAQDTHKRLISNSRTGEFSTTSSSRTGSVPNDEQHSQQLIARRKQALKTHAEGVFAAQLNRERQINDRFSALMTNRYDYYSGGERERERPQTVDSAKMKKTAVGGAHFREGWKQAAVSDGRTSLAAGMSTGSRRRRDEIYSQTFSELFGGSAAIQQHRTRGGGGGGEDSKQPASQQPQSARSASDLTPSSVIRDRMQRKQIVGGFNQHNYNSTHTTPTTTATAATASAPTPAPSAVVAPPPVSGSSSHWSTASRLAYSASPERLKPQRHLTKLGLKAAASGVTLQLRSDAPSDNVMPTAMLLPATKPVMVIPGAASNGNQLIDPIVSSSRFPTARA